MHDIHYDQRYNVLCMLRHQVQHMSMIHEQHSHHRFGIQFVRRGFDYQFRIWKLIFLFNLILEIFVGVCCVTHIYSFHHHVSHQYFLQFVHLLLDYMNGIDSFGSNCFENLKRELHKLVDMVYRLNMLRVDVLDHRSMFQNDMHYNYKKLLR